MEFGKKEAIIINLKQKYNISFESFSNDFYFCGNNGDKKNYFYKIFKNLDFPEFEDKCLCNTNIKKNCYVYNKTTKHIIILGSCCIKKFCKYGIKQTCDLCNKPHKNRIGNKCNECRLIKKLYSGFCIDCNKVIDRKYLKCYICFSK